MMFAWATGLFPDEKVLQPAQHTILLEVVECIAQAMDAERALTQCRRDQFFLRWGEVNELYVPVGYVLAGVAAALEHEHPEMRDVLGAKLQETVNSLLIEDVKACERLAEAAGRRPCVLGKRLQRGYVEIDSVLVQLVHEHAIFVHERQQKAHRIFAKFDKNHDGALEKAEFVKMLATIEPDASEDDVNELWRAAAGKGHDDDATRLEMRVIEEKLFQIGRLHKVATKRPSLKSTGRRAQSIVESAAAQLAREELSVLVALWDSVREAPESEEQDRMQSNVLELLENNWSAVMRLKAWLLFRIERWRKRRAPAPAEEAPQEPA